MRGTLSRFSFLAAWVKKAIKKPTKKYYIIQNSTHVPTLRPETYFVFSKNILCLSSHFEIENVEILVSSVAHVMLNECVISWLSCFWRKYFRCCETG